MQQLSAPGRRNEVHTSILLPQVWCRVTIVSKEHKGHTRVAGTFSRSCAVHTCGRIRCHGTMAHTQRKICTRRVNKALACYRTTKHCQLNLRLTHSACLLRPLRLLRQLAPLRLLRLVGCAALCAERAAELGGDQPMGRENRCREATLLFGRLCTVLGLQSMLVSIAVNVVYSNV